MSALTEELAQVQAILAKPSWGSQDCVTLAFAARKLVARVAELEREREALASAEYERGRVEEREMVVGWIRVAPEAGGIELYPPFARIADRIERGAHVDWMKEQWWLSDRGEG